jgi:hypothetical protein
MKKSIILFLIAFIFLGISQHSVAQKVKVLESSQKKKPDWVNGLQKGYIIVVASSKTLDDAQHKALDKVKEQIISSVAENIQTQSDYFRSEKVKNNSSTYEEEFKVATKTRAADIPFIKGISLSKVDAYYWEKVGDKKSNNFKYYYHIKYPFSQPQLLKLIREFEKADRALTAQLEGLIQKAEETNSIEVMGQTVKELKALNEGFIDVDPRKDKANVAIAKLREKLKNVSIQTVNSTLGEIRIILKIGEQTVTTAHKPKVKSNCAKITSVKSKSPEWIITYTYDECYDDPDNAIIVEFRNAYGKAKNEYYFNINADKIDIFVNNDINITGGDVNDSIVSNANCNISITSKYESGFEVEKVILNFGKESPVIINNINQTFESKGKHDLNLVIEQALNKDIYNSRKYSMIKGSIEYKSVKTGEKSIYKMYNQKITTSW